MKPLIADNIKRLIGNIESVIVGKPNVIVLAVTTLLCRGHLLIEDVPGLGKTMLARTIAQSLALKFKRVQFTPDLLPADITGVSIYNQKTGDFSFKQGPVFTNMLLADEINRANPRTQSSLLESMEERQVTVDGETHKLNSIFMVIATQNPVELQGTYPLPEAQLDRFFMRLSIGYPKADEEVKIMSMQIKEHPLSSLQPVIAGEDLLLMQEAVRNVHISEPIMKYIVEIINATRAHDAVLLGASPRGSLAMMRASQALTLIKGGSFVEPQAVKYAVTHVLGHRIIIKPHSRLKGVTEQSVLEEIVKSVPVPVAKEV